MGRDPSVRFFFSCTSHRVPLLPDLTRLVAAAVSCLSAEYICPKCSHFNPSPNSRQSGVTPSASSSSTGPTKQHQLAQSTTRDSDEEDEAPAGKPIAIATRASKKSAGVVGGKKGKKAAVAEDDGEMDVYQGQE